MRKLTRLVIHCSATPNGRHHTVEDIDLWHRANKWFRNSAAAKECGNPQLTSVGYHRIIYTDGLRVQGRCFQEVPVSVRGWNSDSVALCMIGTNKFTQAQWDSLKLEVLFLASELGIQTIQGHRDLSPDKDGDGVLEKHEWLKDCPGFDVAEWIKNGYTPNKLNVLKK